MLAYEMTLQILCFSQAQIYNISVTNIPLYPIKSFLVDGFWSLDCLKDSIEVHILMLAYKIILQVWLNNIPLYSINLP